MVRGYDVDGTGVETTAWRGFGVFLCFVFGGLHGIGECCAITIIRTCRVSLLYSIQQCSSNPVIPTNSQHAHTIASILSSSDPHMLYLRIVKKPTIRLLQHAFLDRRPRQQKKNGCLWYLIYSGHPPNPPARRTITKPSDARRGGDCGRCCKRMRGLPA